MSENSLTLFCEKYEAVLQKSYFSRRFMRRKVYDGTLYLCFICMTNELYRQSWIFDSNIDYKGVYDVTNSRYSKFHICSSLKSMCNHTLEKHRECVKYDSFMNVHNFWECFINLTDYKNDVSWEKANQNFILKTIRKSKKIDELMVASGSKTEDATTSIFAEHDEDMINLKLTLAKLLSDSSNAADVRLKESSKPKTNAGESYLAKRMRIADAVEKRKKMDLRSNPFSRKTKLEQQYKDNDEVFWNKFSKRKKSTSKIAVNDQNSSDFFEEDPF
jgi:hypothetical protein